MARREFELVNKIVREQNRFRKTTGHHSELRYRRHHINGFATSGIEYIIPDIKRIHGGFYTLELVSIYDYLLGLIIN